MRRVASIPSITGICTSISTTSSRSRDASATAAAPSSANSTSWPYRRQHLAQQLAVRRHVVRDQHAQGADPVGGEHGGLRRDDGIAVLEGELEPEQAALAGLALQADRAAHRLDQRLADRQAEAAAAIVPRGRAVGLDESLEQLRLPMQWDADASIADLEPQPHRARPGASSWRAVSATLPLDGELEPVADQVDQDLAQPGRVATDHERGPGFLLDHQLQSTLARLRRQQGADLLQTRRQREIDPLELEPAGLELRDVQDVVDDAPAAAGRVSWMMST